MPHHGGVKKTGCLVVLLALAAAVVVLRVNLPPADVSAAIDMGGLDRADPVTRTLGGMARELMVKDDVARWVYRDWVVLRTAESQRFGWKARALPFGKWKINTGEE